MSTMETVVAVAEAATLFYVVTSLATPVTSLAVVRTPCMNCMVVDGDPGFAPLSSSEVGGGIVVAIDLSTKTSYCVGGG